MLKKYFKIINIKNKKEFLLLFFIIIFAAILRLYDLGQVPPSPDWDEVSLGYNAYSIMLTGKDEYGKLFPVVLRSFDDYKPALYSYLTIPSIFVFGLDVFAVRLPSAVFGILTVVSIYFLVKELIKLKSGEESFGNQKNLHYFALLSAAVMAISPWHIQFSRVGFESNVGLAFNVFVVLFFLKGLKKSLFLVLSIVFAGLSLYAYQSEKVFTPLLMLVLILIFYKNLFKIDKKYLLGSIVVGILVVLPMINFIINDPNALLRAKGTSIFQDKTSLLQNTIQKLDIDKINNDKLGLILDNRRFEYLKTIVEGYISHWDLNWLFITGDIPRHHAPSMGIAYLFEIPFLFIGIYQFLFGNIGKNISKKAKYLIFSWFLIAPIPASITTGVPHAVRTLNVLPVFVIFIAMGFFTTFLFLKDYSRNSLLKKWIVNLICVILIFPIIFNFIYYLDQYFVQQNYFYSQEWQYGYKEVIDEVNNIGEKYKKIIVSDNWPLDKSYIFFLFYLKYPPSDYQKIGQLQSGGYQDHHYFGKFEFHPINWEKDSKTTNTLFIGNQFEFPQGMKAIKTVYNLAGSEAILFMQK